MTYALRELLLIFPIIYLSVYIFRYLILSFGALGLTSLISKERKIQSSREFTKPQILRELRHSLIAAVPLTLIVSIVYILGVYGLNKLYFNISDYSVIWFFGQIFVLMIILDFWFYVVHRIMHTKLVYKIVHKTHHLSTDPSPFAANSVHPTEAIFDFIFIVLTSLVLPLHPLAIFVFVNISAIWSTIGHLGYEIFPRSFTKSIFGKYLNLATVHNQHHKLFLYNFGYYTTIWDRIFGTLHPDTDKLIKIKSSSNY